MERIQKLIASSGLCSRRTAEEWIRAGRVQVNGALAAIGMQVDPTLDEVVVDGVLIRPVEEKRYLMLNKPRGYVTTLKDEQDRPTVAELVEDCGVRVYPVGRLDMDSEGLLFLTNDGAWMHRILHPSYEVSKKYLVTVAGQVVGAAEKLAAITTLDREVISPAEVQLLWQGRDTALLSITIHEGKNRQIRRMCASVGLSIKRLQRVEEHSVLLGNLPLGKWRDLTIEELHSFDQ